MRIECRILPLILVVTQGIPRQPSARKPRPNAIFAQLSTAAGFIAIKATL